VSWFAKIRKVAALGAVVTTGLLAGAILSVSNAKQRKDKTPPPASKNHPDAGAPDARGEAKGKRKPAKPDAEKVRRAQPIPRDYVE
jgi:hypothetical protein